MNEVCAVNIAGHFCRIKMRFALLPVTVLAVAALVESVRQWHWSAWPLAGLIGVLCYLIVWKSTAPKRNTTSMPSLEKVISDAVAESEILNRIALPSNNVRVSNSRPLEPDEPLVQ